MSQRSISIKSYLQTFLYLVRKCGSSDLEKIKKYIEESNKSDSTKLNYYNSIISLQKLDPTLIKDNLDDIKKARDELQQKITDNRSKNNITPKQKEIINNISNDDIIKLISELNEKKNTNKQALEDYLMLKLLYDGGVLRNDLMSIEITNNKHEATKTDKNLIYLPISNKGLATIYINEFKTSNSPQFKGKPIIRKLDKQTTQDIRNLIENDNRNYLFINNQGRPLSSASYSTKISKIIKNNLGFPASSTILRKIYHTHKYKNMMDEMKKDGGQMGHSPQIIQSCYIANNTE
jgi:site-specific recombinase XerD